MSITLTLSRVDCVAFYVWLWPSRVNIRAIRDWKELEALDGLRQAFNVELKSRIKLLIEWFPLSFSCCRKMPSHQNEWWCSRFTLHSMCSKLNLRFWMDRMLTQAVSYAKVSQEHCEAFQDDVYVMCRCRIKSLVLNIPPLCCFTLGYINCRKRSVK